MTSLSAGSLLDDNLWHDVNVNRLLNHVSLTVDRVVVNASIKGDFVTLDLDKMVHFVEHQILSRIYSFWNI